MAITGLIFDIQRFSIHDGPGIRTTVFFKGCSLRCFWCHNPEGLSKKIQIQFQKNHCILCGACITECPEGAHSFSGNLHEFERARCNACGKCVETCYADALRLVGRKVTVPEVMSEVLADRTFYETSGGGITLSGGEPLLQAEFARALLHASKLEGLHTAIETAGNAPWSAIEIVLPFTDLFMMDLKVINEEKHRQVTGVRNTLILENIRRLACSNKPIWIRTPIIPTVNDTVGEILEIAAFIRTLAELRKSHVQGNWGNSLSWELLEFHRLATDKYIGLGMEYQAKDLVALTKEQMAQLAEAARTSGVLVRSPGSSAAAEP